PPAPARPTSPTRTAPGPTARGPATRGRAARQVRHPALDVPAGRFEQPVELGGDHELRRRPGPDRLERLEVLEGHRLLVDPGRGAVDPGQRLAEAFGPEDRRLAIALGL